jgi:archaellum component FlaC
MAQVFVDYRRGGMKMYTKSWEIEGLEERITELENQQEEAASLLDDVLELLDPDWIDIEDFFENVEHARKIIADIIKELS